MASFNQIIAGFQILAKYVDGDDPCQVDAQHDVIYAGPSSIEQVSDEDRGALEKLGWHIDDSLDCFYHFT